jgi:hypothetical protein
MGLQGSIQVVDLQYTRRLTRVVAAGACQKGKCATTNMRATHSNSIPTKSRGCSLLMAVSAENAATGALPSSSAYALFSKPSSVSFFRSAATTTTEWEHPRCPANQAATSSKVQVL